MPRALLLTGDAAEELDTMYPYYRVQEGGWDVDVSSRTMRDVQLVIHEFDPNSDAYVEKNGRSCRWTCRGPTSTSRATTP